MKARDLTTESKSGSGCLIVALDTGRWLLIQRSDYVPMPLTWSLPGGRTDPGESPDRTARREVEEEIGLDLKSTRLRLIHTNDTYAPRFRFYTFAAVVDEEFEPLLNWESASYEWCDMSALPEPLHWGVSQLTNHAKAMAKLSDFVKEQKQGPRKWHARDLAPGQR